PGETGGRLPPRAARAAATTPMAPTTAIPIAGRLPPVLAPLRAPRPVPIPVLIQRIIAGSGRLTRRPCDATKPCPLRARIAPAVANPDGPQRSIDRLRVLLVDAGEKTVPAQEGSKAPVSIFVEETGKTGFAFLTDLPNPRKLAQVNPGDSVELTPEGGRLIAFSNGMRIGIVEPRVAARLLKLIADGNKYAAGVTSLGDKDVRIIIREIYQDPRNYGKVSFPMAAKSTDLRPYTKGTLIREEMDLEDDLEDDEEDEEIEDLDRVLPPESTTDEAFEDELDEADEA